MLWLVDRDTTVAAIGGRVMGRIWRRQDGAKRIRFIWRREDGAKRMLFIQCSTGHWQWLEWWWRVV